MPFLSEALSVNPNGMALEDGTRAWTYKDLSDEAGSVARRLRTLGVGNGQRVALEGVLDGGLIAALHGVWKAGGTVVSLNHRWTRGERTKALGSLRPHLVLVGDGSGGDGEDDTDPFAKTPAYRLGPPGDPRFPSLYRVDPFDAPLPDRALGDDAVHLLTSGTSGNPKVVGVTFRNLLASAEASRERLDLRATDRWFGSLSLSHIGAVALVTRAAVVGSGILLRGPFSTDRFLELHDEGGITHASLVPTMLHQLLEARDEGVAPGPLRCLLIGGAPAPRGLVRTALEAGLPIALTYGLTEASSQVATAPPELVREKPGTVGLPLPGIETRLTEAGELLVRGPTVSPGQLGSNGWLATGDLAGEDADGHLWIIGRVSDRIISGGENVDPSEVETALQAHPDVEEAVVAGVPDPVWGERVVAAVVSRSPGPQLEKTLREFLRIRLSPAKRPRVIGFIDSIPRNPHGKIDREKVRAYFR